jgi:phosphotriesterase-related protein
VISHDVAFKMDLVRYGGHGYGHILAWIVPSLSRAGLTPGVIGKLLVENPRRILEVDWPEESLASPAEGSGGVRA